MIYDYVQTKPELNEDLLMHYGVKGMKWKNHVYKVKNSVNKAYDQYKKGLLGKRVKAGVKKKYLQTKFGLRGIFNAIEKKKLAKKGEKYNSEKGRNKTYKSRKKDIRQARANAKGTHTSQYYTSSGRRRQIADARTNLNKKKNAQRRANSRR